MGAGLSKSLAWRLRPSGHGMAKHAQSLRLHQELQVGRATRNVERTLCLRTSPGELPTSTPARHAATDYSLESQLKQIWWSPGFGHLRNPRWKRGPREGTLAQNRHSFDVACHASRQSARARLWPPARLGSMAQATQRRRLPRTQFARDSFPVIFKLPRARPGSGQADQTPWHTQHSKSRSLHSFQSQP